MLLAKEATRSKISLVAVMIMTKGHVVVEKDAVKAKAKASKDPEANRQVPKVVMPLQLRLLYTTLDVSNDGVHYT